MLERIIDDGNTAQHRLHLTAFGVGTQRHFVMFRAIIISSLAITAAGEPNR